MFHLENINVWENDTILILGLKEKWDYEILVLWKMFCLHLVCLDQGVLVGVGVLSFRKTNFCFSCSFCFVLFF